MVLVSNAVNRTWEDRGKGDKQANSKLSRKCMLNICVPEIKTLFKAESFVKPGTANTLLCRSSSEELGVLKVSVSVNAR